MSDSKIKSNAKNFLMIAKNGWFNNVQDATDKTFNMIRKTIKAREVRSKSFRIFHAKEVDALLEATLGKYVILEYSDTVCADCIIIINIDYDELNDAEYYELKQAVKRGLF